MKLDAVHDIQIAYRKVLDSMSRPGFICNLGDQASKIDIETGCFHPTVLLALMLLDTEVTFAVVSERASAITKLINQLTYAKAVEVEQADFIFVLHDAAPVDLENALELAKTADLVNPHESALIIVEADAVSQDGTLILKGPGIETECSVQVKTSGNWVDGRAKKNSEYPLGIDLIFVDPKHNLLCLPRTTQIAEQVIG